MDPQRLAGYSGPSRRHTARSRLHRPVGECEGRLSRMQRSLAALVVLHTPRRGADRAARNRAAHRSLLSVQLGLMALDRVLPIPPRRRCEHNEAGSCPGFIAKEPGGRFPAGDRCVAQVGEDVEHPLPPPCCVPVRSDRGYRFARVRCCWRLSVGVTPQLVWGVARSLRRN